MTAFDPSPRIAEELKLPASGVRAVARLLGEGATVPFIARYRKEQTGGLDEVAIRAIEEKREYLLELDARRQTILRAIEGQNKLTPELRRALESCWTRAELEDLYAPYKTKRRTRAAMARERGLEPLAMRILAQPAQGDPRSDARAYVSTDKDVPDVEAALAGARDIVELGQAKKTLSALVAKHSPFAVAVGNGTHGRETADFARGVLAEMNRKDVIVVLVSEAGASVYSASDVAREEMPDVDLTVRGAASIARRLQDPLAELVKLDPKVIGVGQYQHDVDQTLLRKKLDEVVESAVSSVGVELNTASAALLSRVAGVGPSLAKKIVAYRDERGGFRSRPELLDVPGLGPKAFEQAAGFVRIRGAPNPLDASAVHPERYRLVERIAKDAGVPVSALVGNEAVLSRIEWSRYVDVEAGVGALTLEDIKSELAKPGRDPRASFEAPSFRDDVRTLEDVKEGMELEGVVTNVTAFGAFVDIGVHQDGLVHVSQLADRFVKDPHAVVRVGDRLKVRVVSVDLARKRISLSAKQASSIASRRS